MKIQVMVKTDRLGSEVRRTIEVDDEATDQEISEEVQEYVLSSMLVEIDWQRA